MKWKIKAIINEEGQDLYLGDVVNLGGDQEEVTSINLINGMLIINGKVIDVEQIATSINETEIPDDELTNLVQEANEEKSKEN